MELDIELWLHRKLRHLIAIKQNREGKTDVKTG